MLNLSLVIISIILSFILAWKRDPKEHKGWKGTIALIILLIAIFLAIISTINDKKSSKAADKRQQQLINEHQDTKNELVAGRQDNKDLQMEVEGLKEQLLVAEARSLADRARVNLHGIPAYEPVTVLKQIVERTAQSGKIVPRDEIFLMMILVDEIIVQKGWQLEYPTAHFWCQWLSAGDLKQSQSAASFFLWMNEEFIKMSHEQDHENRLKKFDILQSSLCYALNGCRRDLHEIYNRLDLGTEWFTPSNWPNFAKFIMSYCTTPLEIPEGVTWWANTRERWQALKNMQLNNTDLRINQITIQRLDENKEAFYRSQSGSFMLAIRTVSNITFVFQIEVQTLFENPLYEWRVNHGK